MAAAMDDLVANLSSNMHVSQEGYELKALQEYLAQNLPLSIPNAYDYAIQSQSSMSRKHTAFAAYTCPPSTPTSLSLPEIYAQPALLAAFEQPAPMAHEPLAQRPAPRKTLPYGAIPQPYTASKDNQIVESPLANYPSFKSDAFAPICQQQVFEGAENPWAKMKAAPSGDFGFAPSAAKQVILDRGRQCDGLQLGSFQRNEPAVVTLPKDEDTAKSYEEMDEDE
ncbi:uncharacterized protein L203_103376 [Cryptococcus depauperatus CBS 7841]|uniref:Uncharacterized protein n=1 Tax=Cryptococcus depauperatus CBS 7841 TaxID=1295531 RepID=A0A1E3I475_9TREE|nr:hypothetical protein L203_05410 [Cryptococcus depauperatus CBS 7841]